MKIVYRILTPIFAAGAIAMGIFLDMFNFVVGSTDSQINNLINSIAGIAQQLGANIDTKYGFSVFELVKMLGTASPSEDSKSFIELIKPIFPQLIVFLVLMVVIVGIFIAVAVTAATIADTKKRNRLSYILCAAGLVVMFINIIVTNNAFAHIKAGDIDITSIVKMFTDSTIATLATAILSVTSATLSAGFYAMFGMFILIVIWTIIAGFVISSPIVPSKKAYKRKKPMRAIVKPEDHSRNAANNAKAKK